MCLTCIYMLSFAKVSSKKLVLLYISVVECNVILLRHLQQSLILIVHWTALREVSYSENFNLIPRKGNNNGWGDDDAADDLKRISLITC